MKQIIPLIALTLSIAATSRAGVQVTPAWDNILPLGGGTNSVRAAKVDPAGNLVIAATVDAVNPAPPPNTGIINFDMKLVKYDPAGNILWQQQIAAPLGGPPNLSDEVGGMDIDSMGNVFIAG